MSQPLTVMEIFKHLDKSNCGKCGEKSCLAFAASVFTGNRDLFHCPQLPNEITTKFSRPIDNSLPFEEDYNRKLQELRSKLSDIDFAARADQIGAEYHQERMVLKIMGKKLEIDGSGRLFTDLHVNSWVTLTTLFYILNCEGHRPKADWVPLRELPGGQDWFRLFNRQCEMRLKRTADMYPDLFADLVEVFSGKHIGKQFESDISVILYPLPLVPLLFCYWQPEEGMDSSFNLFFDSTAHGNLGMDGLYLLGTGIARMLEKMAQVHSPSRVI